MDLKKVFSNVFLSIFFLKMVIATAPLIAISIDADSVHAVIMQLEIEQETSKGDFKAKVISEFYNRDSSFSFNNEEALLKLKLTLFQCDKHPQAFYPSVPTPPPNA